MMAWSSRPESLQPILSDVDGIRRSCFRQSDGTLILADACICFENRYRWDCPIEAHAIAARMRELETTP